MDSSNFLKGAVLSAEEVRELLAMVPAKDEKEDNSYPEKSCKGGREK